MNARLGHRPALDGLRGLAVALVVAFHAWGWPHAGGELGVEIFFVLSGFLITTLLLEERELTGRIALPQFYVRRALRLLPVLYAVLAVATVVVAFWSVERRWYLESIASVALYVGNFYGVFAEHTDLAPGVEHLWSLAVEEQFYVVWPVALIVVLRLTQGRTRALAGTLVAGILVSVVVRGVLLSMTTAGWTLPTTYSDALLAGGLIAVVRRVRDLPALRWWAAALLVIGCVVPKIDRGAGHGVFFEWLALVGVVLVLTALHEPGWLRWRPLVFLGSISYGLYVIHYALLVGAGNVWPTMNHWVRDTTVVVVSVVVAAASRRWFEAWFLRRKPQPRQVAVGSAVVAPTGR